MSSQEIYIHKTKTSCFYKWSCQAIHSRTDTQGGILNYKAILPAFYLEPFSILRINFIVQNTKGDTSEKLPQDEKSTLISLKRHGHKLGFVDC